MDDKIQPSDLWSGALIGIGIVILQGFFSSNSVDKPALVSVFAFAIAIPILSCNLLTNFIRRSNKKPSESIWEILFYVVGIFAALTGIGAAFWHVCRFATLVFALSSAAGFIVFAIVYYSSGTKKQSSK